MNNIVFDRQSRLIRGIDRETLPFERSIQLPFPITLSKQISIPTNQLIQKTNSEGLPLYKENISINPETNEESYTETLSPQTPTEFETQINTYKIIIGETTEEQINEFGETILISIPIYETITNTSQIPISFQENPPILIPEIIIRTVSIENEYMEFSAEEVTLAKQNAINNANLLKLKAFDEEVEISNFELQNVSSGNGLIILHNLGVITSNPIPLDKLTNMFQIYIESQPDITISISGDNGLTFTDFDSKGKTKLITPTDKVIVKFKNTAINNREIYCYALLA